MTQPYQPGSRQTEDAKAEVDIGLASQVAGRAEWAGRQGRAVLRCRFPRWADLSRRRLRAR